MYESRAIQRQHENDKERIVEIASRYYDQIRHGCGNSACRTPTCLTFEQKRADERPYRRPTVLTARAMAACLATSGHPASRLCPHGSARSESASDRSFPMLGSEMNRVEPGSAAEADPFALPDDLDKKSLLQLLFNSDAWRNARASTASSAAAAALVEITNAIGLEQRVNPSTPEPFLLCAGLDALCDFLPRLDGALGSHMSHQVVWQTWVELRRRGQYLLDPAEHKRANDRHLTQACRELAGKYRDENALRLLRHLLRSFAVHAYAADSPGTQTSYESELLEFLATAPTPLQPLQQHGIAPPRWHQDQSQRLAPTAHVVLEWCRVMLQESWDNQPIFSWGSPTGCAMEALRFLYRHRRLLDIDKKLFATRFLFARMDFMEVPRSWLEDSVPANHCHILSFPWMFPVSSLVTYFRVINHMTMSKAVNESVSLHYLIGRHKILVESNEKQILEKLRIAMGQLLVLEVKRGHILEDAMSGLWRRQKRELRRPLKVRMGMDEGEEGVDFGGVQQEFFRLSLGEALDPDYGLFTLDETTRMTWFLPCSQAPLYQFTLIGILVGLAVYNGITLSVTFPEALYRKLLDEPVDSLEHIEDGWPMLTRGLRSLLEYSDGDVADVFMRSYVFSSSSNGTVVSADMQKHARSLPWPSEGPPEPSELIEENAELVTNATRESYVEDYIFWLTDKSIRPQYDAFATGFFLCVEKSSLRLFDASALQTLVEGHQRVDVGALERTASYDNGYHPHHPVVENFWHVVRSFSDEEVRKLLEFVTASDRVPAKGIEEIVFIIQRNGSDDVRLPTSQTCFGRLLLPEYSDREVLQSKLRQAMVHSLGFGLQ